MVLRGWIRRKNPTHEISKWAFESIKKLLQFYQQCWTLWNKYKYGHNRESNIALQREALLKKIFSAYNSKESIFYRVEDQYTKILFQRKREEWEGVPTANMKKWVVTYDQAVKRRYNCDFDFDVREYFTFEEAVTFQTDVV